MMTKKIIFLDVDGTLVNDSGLVPASAKQAVQAARDNGHDVFLCTGRSKAELHDEILEIGFDGMIAAAGGYIEANETVVFHKSFNNDDVRQLVGYFDDKGIDFYLESNGGLFASKNCKARLTELLLAAPGLDLAVREKILAGTDPFLACLIENEDLHRADVNKISFLGSTVPIEAIKETFFNQFNVISSTVPLFGENSGEVSLPGINKALAIQMLLDHLQLSQQDTLAFGDGINDTEMLSFVQCGIAMGNAKEALKAIADDVTTTHDDDGIYRGFVKYGLIAELQNE